jgi:hypothetical protein
MADIFRLFPEVFNAEDFIYNDLILILATHSFDFSYQDLSYDDNIEIKIALYN